jgi:hypothetical protein
VTLLSNTHLDVPAPTRLYRTKNKLKQWSWTSECLERWLKKVLSDMDPETLSRMVPTSACHSLVAPSMVADVSAARRVDSQLSQSRGA